MFHRFLVAFLVFLHTAALPGQSVAELEAQLRQATASDQRWEITYRLSKNWLITDVNRAADYAKQSLQLAIAMRDKRREAESALLHAEIAERQGHPAEALTLYTQTHQAATAAGLPDLQLQASEKLQVISAKEGNYKAAYDWSRQRSVLLQEKARLYAEEQRKKYEATQTALEAQKKRENSMGMLLLAVLGLILTVVYYLRQRANRRTRGEMAEKNAMIEEKRRRSEQLLLNILPPAVAAELTVRNKVAARRYEHATVMFIDFVGFTKTAEILQPEELIAELDYCFSRFDDLIGRNRIEKIKTVGDAYICASGLSDRNERPTDMIKAALQIQAFLKKFKEKRIEEGRPYFEARIGIHFGPVVAGVVGTKKFAYDIWGDTVNTAARLEEACEAGRINVSGATREVVLDEFQWEYRGKVAAKNKGEMEMYYVEL